MITGFNTDVKYEGVTYHVQTEDKGLNSPLILSLVYVGGTIIASKRTPYEDLISAGFDEKALTDRLKRQHKLICAAIKSGRVEDLKRMGAQNGGSDKPAADAQAEDATAGRTRAGGGQRKKRQEEAAPPPADAAPPTVEAAAPPVEAAPPPVEVAPPPPPSAEAPPKVTPAEAPAEAPSKLRAEAPAAVKNGEAAKGGATAEPDIVILTSPADEVHALRDLYARPAARPDAPVVQAPPVAVAPPAAEPIPVEPILDAEIIEEPGDSANDLYLSLLDDEGDFRAGQLVTVKVYVGRGKYGARPLADASVTVKVLGTSFRPIIMTATTDFQGVAVVRVLLPRFTSGRGAIIIRAARGGDAVEMRRIIHQ